MKTTIQPTSQALNSAVDAIGDLGRPLKSLHCSMLPTAARESLADLPGLYRGLQSVNPARKNKLALVAKGAALLASLLDPTDHPGLASMPENIQDAARVLLNILQPIGMMDPYAMPGARFGLRGNVA